MILVCNCLVDLIYNSIFIFHVIEKLLMINLFKISAETKLVLGNLNHRAGPACGCSQLLLLVAFKLIIWVLEYFD